MCRVIWRTSRRWRERRRAEGEEWREAGRGQARIFIRPWQGPRIRASHKQQTSMPAKQRFQPCETQKWAAAETELWRDGAARHRGRPTCCREANISYPSGRTLFQRNVSRDVSLPSRGNGEARTWEPAKCLGLMDRWMDLEGQGEWNSSIYPGESIPEIGSAIDLESGQEERNTSVCGRRDGTNTTE